MHIKKTLNTLARQGRITRYRTYKHLGFLGHRKGIDRLAKITFILMLGLCTLSFFCLTIRQEPNVLSDVLEENTPIAPTLTPPTDVLSATDAPDDEAFHADLGDAPVISDTSMVLNELERGTAAGRYKMTPYTLEKGETLITLLNRAGVEASARTQVIEGFSLLVNLKSLQPGMTFLVFTDTTGAFLGISLPAKNGEVIAVAKEGDEYTPFSEAGRVETQNIRVSGNIERTFSGSAQKAGLPKVLISQITNALDGEVDFSALKAGDAFDIIYEQKTTAGGLELGDKQLLYVGLTIGKKHIHRYAWTSGGTSTFFNPQGKSAEKPLLKKPVKAKPRLSSPYGWRSHPILMARIFHSGVDLACPMNTPIIAAGDGVITQLGRKGAYGKYIRIRHANGYQTAYGHLNGYKSGLKTGSQVKRGDVIGYVGQTGRATGPHVHFEVWKNNKTVNPFGNHVLIAKQLTGDELARFQRDAKAIHPEFDKHLVGTLAPVPPQKPTFKTAPVK
ncbi:MAG: peptidoglycan DD-metalloendopeptidase family protein [Alphaproteobacteria bacterium]